MDYVVLTDYPDEFVQFAEETGKILAIVDIHEARKNDTWSPEVEHVPSKTQDETLYGNQYLQNLSSNKNFSYALHRYSLPTISQLGFNKIVFMDSDVRIKYAEIGNTITEEQFWEEFDTTPNTMKGCAKEEVFIEKPDNNAFQVSLQLTRAMGYDMSMGALQVASIVLHQLYTKFNIARCPVIHRMEITEGPFRYYHFDSPSKVLSYFNTWNETVRQIFTNSFLLNFQRCGGYTMCDYMPVGITNIFENITVENFPNTVYQRRIFYEDRYFIPPMAAGMSREFNAATSKEEFFEKNKELVNTMYERNAWPHIEPY